MRAFPMVPPILWNDPFSGLRAPIYGMQTEWRLQFRLRRRVLDIACAAGTHLEEFHARRPRPPRDLRQMTALIAASGVATWRLAVHSALEETITI